MGRSGRASAARPARAASGLGRGPAGGTPARPRSGGDRTARPLAADGSDGRRPGEDGLGRRTAPAGRPAEGPGGPT